MNDDALDRDVRDALEPDAGAIERIVRGAMQGAPRTRPVGRFLLAASGVIAVLAVGAQFLHQDTPGAPPATVRLTNIDDTVVVTPASGAVWLVGGRGSVDARLPAGMIVVHRSGVSR